MRTRRGVSTSVLIATAIVVVIIVGAAAYFAALSSVGGPTTITKTFTSTSVSTAVSTSISTAISTSFATSTTTTTATGQPIIIGLISPLTGAGAGFGQLQVDGAQLAVKEINAKGGVNGRPLQLVTEDEASSTSASITDAQILVSQFGANFIIGPSYSGDVAAVLPYLNQNKVIELITSASSDALMKPPQNQYLFRVGISDQGIAFYAYSWLQKIGAKTIAYEGEDYLYVHEIENETRAYLSGTGITVVSADYFPGTASDYSAAINKIASLHPDAVVAVFSSTNSIDFQKQYSANPVTQKIPINQLDSILDLTQNAASVNAATPNGMNYVFVSELTTLSNQTTAFNQKLQAAFNIGSNSYSPDVYAAVYVLVQAIASAGSTNTDAVQAALLKTNYCGPSGCVKFQASHNSFYGVGFVTGTILQAIVSGTTTRYNIVWPPNFANATAINPSTGQPYP